ncbi:MAG: hypothetical protein JNL18_08810 [Planctomycetaceae bacterium]|nr:hypothetical protein [Planctomycetaceae bacterium]
MQIPRHRSILNDADRERWDEYRRRRDDYKSLLVSRLVIDAALTRPEMAPLRQSGERQALQEWLGKSLAAMFPNDGELMQISLPVGHLNEDQSIQVLDAVATSFHEKVLLQERLKQASLQSDFKTVVVDLKNRLDAQLKDLHNMESASPPVAATEIALLKERCSVESRLLGECELQLLKFQLANQLEELAERTGRFGAGRPEILQRAAMARR